MARQMLKQEDKRIHGIEVREKVSTDLKERRRLRVAEMIVSCVVDSCSI